ncbi:MAG: hypothetical protein QOG79_3152 [Mycobacterium sp.]|jgi:acyl-CoA synthetase (AMP-forming)/AMP-acid ligase II|nr:hypothetical protein [Mycobacterium sp.]MDT5237809.1 hypothetical protein [Mycobacterium sp.]MDT5291684.1 hypothetical protein [Mycobacterium sp.]MDT5299910.1 hypothetical protein [Mycobacterium sp.]
MDVRRTYDFMGDNARPCRWPTLTRLPSGRLQWPTPDSTVRIARYSARRCEGLSMGDERPWQTLANYQDLANYKVPRMIMVLDELPHSSASKIVRNELQELVEPNEGTP